MLFNKMKISIQKNIIKGISTYGKFRYNSPHTPPLLLLPTPRLEALDLVYGMSDDTKSNIRFSVSHEF